MGKSPRSGIVESKFHVNFKLYWMKNPKENIGKQNIIMLPKNNTSILSRTHPGMQGCFNIRNLGV